MSTATPALLRGATLVIAPRRCPLGVLGFAAGIARSRVLRRGVTRLVVGALLVMAAARFVPVGAAQSCAGPTAGIVALWLLAYAMVKQPQGTPARRPGRRPRPLDGTGDLRPQEQ